MADAGAAMTQPVDVAQAMEILSRTPGVLKVWLTGLSRAWTHGDYGPDTFRPYDVVGHLIQGERTDWIVRARIIFEEGTSRPFERYDRYAMFESSAGKPLEALLAEFERLRAENLAALRGLALTPEKLARRGMHPMLGEVTLSQLIATWAAHDLNHLAQIAKAMAAQYQEAVGPWREYLGILKAPATRMDAEGAERARRSRAREGGA
ncbi:MAG: DinB family protein [Phycisphaerae bacterium]|nr:DinB family protein [Phycisphaerae bacterium]